MLKIWSWKCFRSRYRNELIVSAFLFLGALALYTVFGRALQRTSVNNYRDFLFGMDIRRVINDMTEFSANHVRTSVHPLYVLFVNPLGNALTKIHLLRGAEYTVALIVDVFCGALCVVLAFVIFRLMSPKLLNPICLTLIFAFSMSPLLFSTTPETSDLATCSLLVTYLLFWLNATTTHKISLGMWIFAGVFSLGVTTTNFVQTLICFCFARFSWRRRAAEGRKFLRSLGVMVGGVLAIGMLFALLQKAIYPSSPA